jgi:hypothetical protein
MKLQILDEGLDSNREGEKLFHFLTRLTETRTMLITSVSFLNEVATETQKLSSSGFIF